MADIKNVYQVVEEMGNSSAMVKRTTSKQHESRSRKVLGYSSELRREAVAGEKRSKPFW